MPETFDRRSSLEELEGFRWPAPPADSTPMVRNVHELRRRPVASLEPHELARLIGQDVGLRWLLPPAVEILRETAPRQAEGGWFDDDLLYAVVTRKPAVWAAAPDLAHELGQIIASLSGLSRSLRRETDAFLSALPADDV
ncbi:contact-dependent growth inhibition system immunity protein [Streptomyces aureus]